MRAALVIGLALSGCLLAQERPGSADDEVGGGPDSGWVELAVGGDQICALHSDGSLWCGRQGGQQRVDAEAYTSLGGAYGHGVCAVRSDGVVSCGLGARRYDGGFDAAAFELEGPFVSVSGTSDAGCALADTGSARCWPDATQVPGPFKLIGAGDSFACGVRTRSSKLACWSVDDLVFKEPLDDVPGGNFTQVVTADSIGCALTRDGEPMCWGYDFHEILPGPPPATYAYLWLSTANGCAIRDDGRAVCWGEDAGDPNHPELDPPQDTKWARIAFDSDLGCGITADDGALVCWGAPS